MERPSVTIHMMTSIDGKIDGDYMERKDSIASGEAYDGVIFDLGEAMAGGSYTASLYFAHEEVDLSKYQKQAVPAGDYPLNEGPGPYSFVFDRYGKCRWKEGKEEYAGRAMQVVEVVTELTPPGFLAYCRDKGIAYLLAGEKDLDLALALKKIGQLYHLKRLVLTGGATINGAFLQDDLVDEISLVVAPYVEGKPEIKTFALIKDGSIPAAFHYQKACPLPTGGVQLFFTRANRQ